MLKTAQQFNADMCCDFHLYFTQYSMTQYFKYFARKMYFYNHS